MTNTREDARTPPPAGQGQHRRAEPYDRRIGISPALAALALGSVLAFGSLSWNWATRTPVLGAHLSTLPHVTFVATFLLAAGLAAVVLVRWTYRLASQLSQRARRHRW